MDSLQSIFGQHDSYIAKIEKQLHVTVVNRDGSAKIIGEERNAQRAAELIEELARSIHRGTDLEEQRVDYCPAACTGGRECISAGYGQHVHLPYSGRQAC